MIKDDQLSKLSIFVSVVITVMLTPMIFGCVAEHKPTETISSLSADQLTYYNETFESIREDVWDRSGMVFNESQLPNFKLADLSIEDGTLNIKTQTNAFSKGGLDTKYAVRGDFDIEIECSFDPLTGTHNMDQRLTFLAYDKEKTIEKSDYILIEIAKRGGDAKGGILAGYARTGQFRAGTWREIDSFNGYLKMTRKGNKISTYYRKKGKHNYQKLNTFSVSDADLTISFMLSNFYSSRDKIEADRPLQAKFDNFMIYAAQDIVESDI